MTGPHVLFAADPEISRLVREWQAQAEEAVRVGLRMAQRLVELERQRDQLRLDNAAQVSELIRLRGESAEWQETAEAYCGHAGRRHTLLKRIHAACGRAISGDHDKKSMLDTLQLCAGMAADETRPTRPPGGLS